MGSSLRLVFLDNHFQRNESLDGAVGEVLKCVHQPTHRGLQTTFVLRFYVYPSGPKCCPEPIFRILNTPATGDLPGPAYYLLRLVWGSISYRKFI